MKDVVIPARFDTQKIEAAVGMLLEAVGMDPHQPDLQATPNRVARMFEEILGGIGRDPRRELDTVLAEDHDEIVLVKDIPIYSMCEHHLLPFLGKAHVAYLPRRKVTGLSKLARVVEVLSRRLQVQERLTTQIADVIMEVLEPRGVLVVLEAEHLCMSMRGVKKSGALTITSAVRGLFREDPRTRAEAMALIRGR